MSPNTELRNPQISVKFKKTKRPNIVLIYAESLEQRYFDENIFPGLLPKLKKIREESIDFTNVSQGVGAGWTIGGIVASQCGYPLTVLHDIDANDLSLFDQFLPRAKCLGDLLEEDGYRSSFIGGAYALFAGKDKFLKSHGYAEVIDREVLEKNLTDRAYINDWGVYDDTMFDYAAEKFVTLSNEPAPFLLTLLSLDPHGYNGYLSESCMPYQAGDSSILNSFHCSDQLISGFIKKVRSSPYSDNTLIVVLSDHLAMRNQATSLLNSSQMPRRLTFFVNTPEGRSRVNENSGLHYDIAPTILDTLGYRLEGQMGFGTSLEQGAGYLISKFGEGSWEKQAESLKSIGNALWDLEVILGQDGIRFIDADMSLIMGEREFNLRSWGATNVPASTLFIFDKHSLQLEKIKSYAFDKGINTGTLSKEILDYKENLVFAISRAMNLPGFSDPRTNPDRWVYFFGKAGSNLFSQGTIVGDFQIPIDLIRKYSISKIDNNILRQRQAILKATISKQKGAAGSL